MLRLNFKLALVLLFGWLLADSVYSILGNPLSGMYYPLASGRLKSVPTDWTTKPWYSAPVYFAAFACIWILFSHLVRVSKGLRAASLVTALVMAPFWNPLAGPEWLVPTGKIVATAAPACGAGSGCRW